MRKIQLVFNNLQQYNLRLPVFDNMWVLLRLNTLKDNRAIISLNKILQKLQALLKLRSQGVFENLRIQAVHIALRGYKQLFLCAVITDNA